MDQVAVLVSSAAISATFGATAGYLSQRALAGRQARLGYEYNARKRLYEAVGPLRFQLLMASRDVVRRVAGHSREKHWNLDPAGYYGSNTLYRLLKPLGVCILIERQMNAADFSVDPSSVKLLQFEVGAYRMLTNADPLPYHSGLDWARETQHVFRDNLRRAAARLIKVDQQGHQVVMDYAEFLAECPDPASDEALAPLARIIKDSGTSLTRNGVFWVRVVGYAYLCQLFIAANGAGLGFTQRPIEVRRLLEPVDDSQVRAHLGNQEQIYQGIADEGL